MRQLDPQDATFLYLEGPNRGTHATFVWIYDPAEAPDRTIAFSDLVKHVESRLHVAKLLYQKLVRVPFALDYPYWADDADFAIANHLHEATLPGPGDWATFCRIVSEIHARALDLGRPLWEIHLVRGLEIEGLPERAFAVLMKLHHVALDGATGMALVQGLHDLEPTPLARPSRKWKTPTAERAPEPLEMLVAAARNNLDFARRGVRAAVQLAGRLPRVLSTVRLTSLLNASDAPETLFNQDVAAERSFGLAVADLEQIKQVRHAVPGATVNDVLLTICGGALRRFLESKSALPEASMVSVCPINVRSADEADSAGNRIAVMTARIHTDVADPLERLRAVHRSTRKSKSVVDSIGAREMLELNNTVPSPVQALAIGLANRLPRVKRIPRFFNLSISNLPGPHSTLYLGGARLLHVGGSMPVGNGYGLFIAICSYDGKVSFSVSSARNILPDPEQLMVHFPHALAELRHAVANQGAPQRKALAPVVARRSKEAP